MEVGDENTWFTECLRFDNREQIKARREIDNVVEGHYDHQQKQGFSMRR